MENGSGLQNEREKGHAFTLHHYTKTMMAKAESFNRRFPIDQYFLPLIGDKKQVSIADIGAGMWSTTGSLLDGVDITVHPSDELAEQYMGVLKQNNITPLFPIEKQDMEHLTYPDNSFDIVHCVNALDHCLHPDLAIKEMYRICKPGGYIYLRHYFNTALHQRERGLHKWNIILTINYDCVFWGPLGAFLLSACVPGFVNEGRKEIGYEKYRQVVSILHKP